MPQEVVTLKIGLEGQQAAEQALEKLDKLSTELNGKKISLAVDTSSLQAFSQEMEKSIQAATKNINAQARLLEAKNKEASVNAKIQQELAKQATAQAKVAAEVEKTKQASEKTAQAQAKATAEAEKAKQAAEKTAQAQAKVQEAQVKAFETEAKIAVESEKVKQQIEKTAQAEAKLATEAQKTATVEEKRQLLAEQMSAAYEKANMKAEALNASTSEVSSTPLQQQIEALTGVSNEYKSAAESAKVFEEVAKKAGEATGDKISTDSISTKGFSEYINGLEGMQGATVAATKTVKAADSTFQQFSVSVKNGAGDYDNFTYSVDKATGSIYKMEEGASSANKTASKLQKTLGGAVAEFAKWAVVGALFYAPIQAFSDALTELKKVDSELIDIQKVMGATAGEMEQLSEKAFEVGSNLGVAASDYLASVTKWAQAGYGSLSDELGELSVKTQKVGDVEEATANQFLLSVDAAYKYKGSISELTKVLDGANEISNNYATSVDKLASGMGIVSSLAAQAGMEVQETMAAIGTITAVTQESGNSAARALRALILNIQGSTEIAIDEETGERWTEDEIKQTAAALEELTVSTREYKNGVEQLRNPMKVIGELSDKYKAGLIDEVQLQEVVSSLGGKVRSNQLQALISNYDMYEEMLNTYSTSVGSADRELDIYLNSWEAKSERLKNSWVELVATFKADDAIKNLLDIGNALMTVANTPVGNIGVVAGAMTTLNAGFSAFKKTDSGKEFLSVISNVGKALSETWKEIKTLPSQTMKLAKSLAGAGGASEALGVLKSAAGGAATAMKGIGSAIYAAMGPVGIIVTALYAISTVSDILITSAEEQKEAFESLIAEYEDGQSTLESLKSQYEEVSEKIEELNKARSDGDFSATDQEELDTLNEQNLSLERQIILQEKLNATKKEELDIASKRALETGFSQTDFSGIEGALDRASDVLSSAYEQLFGENAYAFNEMGMRNALAFLGDTGGFDKQAEYISNTLDELNRKKEEFISEHGDQSGWTEKEVKDFEALEDHITYTESLAIDFYQELQQYIDGLTDEDQIQYWQSVANSLFSAIAPTKALKEQIDLLLSGMSDEEFKTFNEQLNILKEDGALTVEEVKKLAEQFPILNTLVESGSATWEQLAEYLMGAGNEAENTSNGLDDLKTSEEMAAEAAEKLSEKLDNAISAMRNITDAQDELNKTGKLSIDTVVGLIEKYPELNDVLTMYLAGLASEADLQAALAEEYDRNANEYKQAILDKMADSEEFYNAVVLGNEQTVAKLKALGLEDLDNYKTVEDLKSAAHSEAENEQTRATAEATKSRILMYQQELSTFLKALNATGNNSGVSGSINKFLGSVGVTIQNELNKGLKEAEDALNSIGPSLEEINEILYSGISLPNLSDSSGSSSSSGGSSGSSGSSSTKSWYETQIEALQDLVNSVKDTNTLLEKEDKNSAEKRIQNLMETQATISKMADAFRAKGLSNSSDEVKQLKLMWHDLADEIEVAYQSMYDALMDEQGDKEWSINLFEKNADRADKSVEEISADNEKIVASYEEMQKEIKALADYYRSKGYDETDDLIQDLSDAWWDYQDKIESVYDRLSEAFEDYISESDRQIKELERTTGTAGQQIELYTQRIQEAQKAIAELQKTNVNGLNDDRIGSIQDQIYSDEDAISSIRDSLGQELVDAVDREFDKKQDEIDEAQDKLDYFNQKVTDLDEELQDIVGPLQDEIDEWQYQLEQSLDDPAWDFFNESLRGAGMSITEAIEKYTDAIDAEKEALEEAIDPLRKQIEGYYLVNPDGTIGAYVPGLEDDRDYWQDLLDAENERWEEERKQHDQDKALQEKEIALQEAIKNLEQAQLDLETAKNERTVYTLKDGVWAWRPDEEAIKDAEDALDDAKEEVENAKEELEWEKLEQAHENLANFYEKQVKLEEEKIEALEDQIEALERESEARQDALQDQLEIWQDEKEAQEKYYNDLIEQNEKLIKEHERHYEELKRAYDSDIEFWTNEVKRLQEQYDEWADQWDDIQDAMTDDVRSIEEILADIANYGTPQMKEQIDKVTDLLEQMGVAIGDFNVSMGDINNGGSSGGGTGGTSEADIIEQMKQNAQAWKDAMGREDFDAADYYYRQNQMLGAQIGATFNPNNGVWYDRYGNELFSTNYNGMGNNWGNGYESSGSSSGGSWSEPNYSGGTSTGGSGSGSSGNLTHEQAVIAEMMKNKQAWQEATANGYEIEAERYYKLNQALGQSIGATFDSNTGTWYKDGKPLFDHGGIAEGRGVMLKAVDEPEMVLSPVLASTVLNPVQNVEFDRFTKDLGILFGASGQYAQSTQTIPANNTTNHTTDSHNTYINGVQIGESLMEKPLSEVLSLLGLYQNM